VLVGQERTSAVVTQRLATLPIWVPRFLRSNRKAPPERGLPSSWAVQWSRYELGQVAIALRIARR
jgi:hypothetical protein